MVCVFLMKKVGGFLGGGCLKERWVNENDSHLTWFVKCSFLVNFFWQKLHWKGVSPVCNLNFVCPPEVQVRAFVCERTFFFIFWFDLVHFHFRFVAWHLYFKQFGRYGRESFCFSISILGGLKKTSQRTTTNRRDFS